MRKDLKAMKDRYLILISIVLVILQTTALPFLRIAGVVFSLPLIFLISGTVVFGHWKGLRIAIYLGVCLDILIGRGLGVYVFLYLSISYIISSFEEKIFKDNFVTPIILFVFAAFFETLYFLIYQYMSTGYAIGFRAFLVNFVVYSLYNGILGIPVYSYFMKKYMGYSMR